MKGPLIAIATVALGFVVGRLSVGGDEASAPTVVASTPRPPQAAPLQLDPSSLGAVRAAVRQELAAAASPVPAPATPEPPSPVEHDPAALAKAHEVVNRATGAGRWTPADARVLRGVLPRLTAEEMDEVMSALTRLANQGGLRVETSGSLLAPEEVK